MDLGSLTCYFSLPVELLRTKIQKQRYWTIGHVNKSPCLAAMMLGEKHNTTLLSDVHQKKKKDTSVVLHYRQKKLEGSD